MPYGPGTYGSQVGRPKNNSDGKRIIKTAARSKRTRGNGTFNVATKTENIKAKKGSTAGASV